ncbi:hypothetical protein MCETE7_00995 [Acidimicrobiia bacterium]
MVRPSLDRSPSFDFGDHGSIETDTDMKEKMPVVHDTQTDSSNRVEGQGIEKDTGGFDRVVWKSQRPGEDVGGSPGEGGECGVGSGESICGFIEGAIAAQNNHNVETVGRSLAGELGGMAPMGRLEDRDLMVRS